MNYYYKEITTANPPTNTVDFGGFDSSIILFFKEWNSHAHRE